MGERIFHQPGALRGVWQINGGKLRVDHHPKNLDGFFRLVSENSWTTIDNLRETITNQQETWYLLVSLATT